MVIYKLAIHNVLRSIAWPSRTVSELHLKSNLWRTRGQ